MRENEKEKTNEWGRIRRRGEKKIIQKIPLIAGFGTLLLSFNR